MGKKIGYSNTMKDFTNISGNHGADHSYLGSLAGSVKSGMKKMSANPSGKNSEGKQPSLCEDKVNKPKAPFKQKKESKKMEDSEY